MLEQAIYRFCTEKVKEKDIKEFSQFLIENLSVYEEQKEDDKAE